MTPFPSSTLYLPPDSGCESNTDEECKDTSSHRGGDTADVYLVALLSVFLPIRVWRLHRDASLWIAELDLIFWSRDRGADGANVSERWHVHGPVGGEGGGRSVGRINDGVNASSCVCTCVCVYEVALRPRADTICCGLKSLGGDGRRTHAEETPSRNHLCDGWWSYMGRNDPRAKSCIYLGAISAHDDATRLLFSSVTFHDWCAKSVSIIQFGLFLEFQWTRCTDGRTVRELRFH